MRFFRYTSIVAACAVFGFATCSFGISVNQAHAQTSAAGQTNQQAALQAQLDEVLQEIAQQQADLATEQKKGDSIERDIAILDGQIHEANLKIQAKNLAIATLDKNISQKTQTITSLSDKIDAGNASLADLIRQENETQDETTVVDLMLSDQTLSGLFLDMDESLSVNRAIANTILGIKQNKSSQEQAKQELATQEAQQVDAKISIEEQQAQIKSSEKQKNTLLSLSKSQQKNYKNVIAQKQAKAASIRAALFALRDTGSIPFGTALDYANQVEKLTGVDPAFLLAIMTQESNLGENVGACYVTNMTTGDGVKISSGAAVSGVMKPSRDIQPFLAITKAAGRDPTKTRVSCPWGDGYGGAMGPAQFIPSTWVLFEDRITSALHTQYSDPWNARDAFMASALYLADLGAAGGSSSAERNAACKYYSGRSCDDQSPANSFYGDQVMAKAIDIQVNMIDPINAAK